MKSINYEKIAEELKGVNNWCCFDEVEIKGKDKKGKVPVDANICTYGKLYKAKSNDSNTWATYQIAEEKSKALNIGLMFRIDYPYIFLDFDDCIDENGNINNKIKEIMKQVNSYTEISNSGKGIHIIVKVHEKFQAKVDHNQGIEIYNNRFCVMTGDVLEEYSTNIEDRTDVIKKLYKQFFSSNNTIKENNSYSITKDIAEFFSSIKGSKFNKNINYFFSGDWKKVKNYPSQSEADSAFMLLLAKTTNSNRELMDKIFRTSAMYREKYDEPHYNDGRTYGQGLIDNAVTLVTDFFINEKENLKDSVIDLLLNNTELFHNSIEECYAIIEIDNHNEIYNLESSKFYNYVAMLIYEKYKKTLPKESIKGIINTLKGIALFQGKERKNYMRSATKEKNIYYDLTNDKWEVVEINENGWNIVSESPILFTRESHQKGQVTPVKEGNIDLLWEYINVHKDEKILVIAYICAMFIENIPRPILILHGEKGASKTTTSKMIRELVDPSILGTINMADKENELVQILSKHYVVPFDNIGTITNKISDMLCRAVTR